MKGEFYSELEAAEALGITISELHHLLDEHIFNDGTPRPQNLDFRYSELLLLSVWSGRPIIRKVVEMPLRVATKASAS
jgi:hypothetical protein